MSSQYLCCMSRPDMSHIIHEVFISDGSGEMECVQALINCGVTIIFMSPRLRTRLCLADEPAYVMTLGLNGHVFAHASAIPITAFTVHSLEHLSPVQESKVHVVPMREYDLVMGVPWFQSIYPDVDWQIG